VPGPPHGSRRLALRVGLELVVLALVIHLLLPQLAGLRATGDVLARVAS